MRIDDNLLYGYTESEQKELMYISSQTPFRMLDILNTYHATSKSFEQTKLILSTALKLAIHPIDICRLIKK